MIIYQDSFKAHTEHGNFHLQCWYSLHEKLRQLTVCWQSCRINTNTVHVWVGLIFPEETPVKQQRNLFSNVWIDLRLSPENREWGNPNVCFHAQDLETVRCVIKHDFTVQNKLFHHLLWGYNTSSSNAFFSAYTIAKCVTMHLNFSLHFTCIQCFFIYITIIAALTVKWKKQPIPKQLPVPYNLSFANQTYCQSCLWEWQRKCSQHLVLTC